jgi:opacity protein-like surface antigen
MKKIFTSAAFLFVFMTAYAQMGSLALSIGVPQNDFKENTDAVGFGFDLSIAFPFQKGTPIYAGLDINYMIYGKNAQNEDLSAQIRSSTGTLLGTLDIPLRIVNTNSLFGTHAFIRAVAPFSNVQPYAEGLAGFRYISTNTKILDRSDDRRYSDDDDDIIVRKTILDDFIFSYGFGGGLMFKLKPNIFLDLRADFFKGQRAQFFDGTDTESWSVEFTGTEAAYDPGNIQKGDLDFSTESRESTTDMLVLKFGVVGNF